MKTIKLEESNKNIIVDAINDVEGKSKINCLSFNTLLELAKHAEKEMQHLQIPIIKRAGAEFYFCPAGPWANSYKYGQGATDALIVRKSTAWYIAKIERIKVFPRSSESRHLIITVEQKNIAVEKFCRSFITKFEPATMTATAKGDSNEQ